VSVNAATGEVTATYPTAPINANNDGGILTAGEASTITTSTRTMGPYSEPGLLGPRTGTAGDFLDAAVSGGL